MSLIVQVSSFIILLHVLLFIKHCSRTILDYQIENVQESASRDIIDTISLINVFLAMLARPQH